MSCTDGDMAAAIVSALSNRLTELVETFNYVLNSEENTKYITHDEQIELIVRTMEALLLDETVWELAMTMVKE